MIGHDGTDREGGRAGARRRLAKAAVVAFAFAALGVAGYSGALASHSDGWDDDWVFASGGSGGSGGSGWDDGVGFVPSGGFVGSGGSGGSGWDDD